MHDYVFFCICIIFCLGVGSIRNLNFNNVDGSISWDPPHTAGVLGKLFYQLAMINNNTGQVIVNTTTTLTSYGFLFELCQVYVGQVTAHVGNIAGETVVQQHISIGVFDCFHTFYPLKCSCKAHEFDCVRMFYVFFEL